MGNRPVEKKKRKKGRPSLLDLQKRSLRLQKKQQEQHQTNQNPNPYLRFPNSTASRRPRNPDLAIADDDDEDDDEDLGSSGKKREKKLKLVLRLPDGVPANSASDLASFGYESERKRKIIAVAADLKKEERHNSASKTIDDIQGHPSDSGSVTPLPDKKLLVFILDRLQKKDTYGVFSEPVDPEELPDYHDVIKHPMDFGTVRKKLERGAYANLEQFEKDVFLISSNAMQYNSPDTIYFRQARSIDELAKKDFENLRQESDDNDLEPRTIRRGRPPNKNTIKRVAGRPAAERAGSDFSLGTTLANARDNGSWSSHGLCNTERYSWASERKSDRNEENSGGAGRYGKKPSVIDENRRSTYNQFQASASVREPLALTTFNGEMKLLVPVGLYVEHAYARSLARFAAKLGPVGWEIAAKRIEKVLPPGTKFGPGWVVDPETPEQSSKPLLSTSPPQPSPQLSNHEGGSNLHENTVTRTTMEGSETPRRFSLLSQFKEMARPARPIGSSLNPKPGPVPPDLNVGFKSPVGSPASGALVDSRQPDLALQL